MIDLFREGGFPMGWLLAFGLTTLAFAARFAWIPVRRMLRMTFVLAGATACATLTAVCADLAAVGHHAPAYWAEHSDMTFAQVLLQGAAESLSPAILGFTMLSLSGVILALGFQREVATQNGPVG
jgi:hypothetical protein